MCGLLWHSSFIHLQRPMETRQECLQFVQVCSPAALSTVGGLATSVMKSEVAAIANPISTLCSVYTVCKHTFT